MLSLLRPQIMADLELKVSGINLIIILSEMSTSNWCDQCHSGLNFWYLFYRLIYLQKYGLKVYLRDPNSFTPMLEEPQPSTGLPRSLLIGSDHKLTHQQISAFSKKDADVRFAISQFRV